MRIIIEAAISSALLLPIDYIKKYNDSQGLFFLIPQIDTMEQSHIVLRKFASITPHYFWKILDIKASEIDYKF
jgi:hypothetical protein